MKRLLLALMFLLIAHAVSAQQVITIHNAPQGVSQCYIPAQVMLHTIGQFNAQGIQPCPFIDMQAHWRAPGAGGNLSPDPPFTLVHDLAHSGHLGCNWAPGGELAAGSYTLPCRIMLFHTAGAIKDAGSGHLVGGDLVTNVTFDDPTLIPDAPLVGDPAGLKQWFFHATFTIRAGLWPPNDNIPTPIPPHGFFSMRIAYRTFFDNGDVINTQVNWFAYSMLDPMQPDAGPREGSTNLNAETSGAGHLDTENGAWGTSLVETKDQCLPLWAPIASPLQCTVLSYMYAPTPLTGTYEILANPDFHMAVPGVPQVFRSSTSTSGITNTDFFDPKAIAATTAPMGYPANQDRICLTWHEASDPINPTIGVHGGIIAANEESIALMCFDVAIGPNPVGCDPTLCPPGPPPSPPPPPPPSTVLVPNVVGMLDGPARTSITAAHLTVGTVTTMSGIQPAGTVITQSPAAGANVQPGSAVAFVESSGPPAPITVTIPVTSQSVTPAGPKCTGSVTGTSTDGGKTITVSSGTLTCQ